MNKARRAEMDRLKHKKRCKALLLNPKEHYCYKSQSTPCSCAMCSPGKVEEKAKYQYKLNRGKY